MNPDPETYFKRKTIKEIYPDGIYGSKTTNYSNYNSYLSLSYLIFRILRFIYQSLDFIVN